MSIFGIFSVAFIATVIRVSTPLILPAMGGLLSELGGAINIALEGIMLAAAFTGVIVSGYAPQWFPGAPDWVYAGLTGGAGGRAGRHGDGLADRLLPPRTQDRYHPHRAGNEHPGGGRHGLSDVLADGRQGQHLHARQRAIAGGADSVREQHPRTWARCSTAKTARATTS
jgi:hypothetical protein